MQTARTGRSSGAGRTISEAKTVQHDFTTRDARRFPDVRAGTGGSALGLQCVGRYWGDAALAGAVAVIENLLRGGLKA